jgi:hypothetical protein
MAGIQRENITQGEAHPGPGDLTASAKSYIDADGGSITWQPQGSKEGFNLSASLQVSPAAREPPSSPRSRASSHSTSSTPPPPPLPLTPCIFAQFLGPASFPALPCFWSRPQGRAPRSWPAIAPCGQFRASEGKNATTREGLEEGGRLRRRGQDGRRWLKAAPNAATPFLASLVSISGQPRLHPLNAC